MKQFLNDTVIIVFNELHAEILSIINVYHLSHTIIPTLYCCYSTTKNVYRVTRATPGYSNHAKVLLTPKY